MTHTGYRYNADNQILGDNANGTYGYDFDGNQQATGSAALVYDAANRLVSYTRGNLALTFGYRPDGLRAWKATNGGARTYYYYDGSRLQFELTQQTDGSWATTRYYAWDASGIYESWTPGEGRIAYLFDPQGSAVSRRAERGSSPGVWSSAAVYDAYGQVRQYDATDTLSDPVGYNGQSGYYTDIAALAAPGANNTQPGLILCGHRYYSPDLARWLTRDPLGYEGGINVYAYCENDPVNGIDPSGLQLTLPGKGFPRKYPFPKVPKKAKPVGGRDNFGTPGFSSHDKEVAAVIAAIIATTAICPTVAAMIGGGGETLAGGVTLETVADALARKMAHLPMGAFEHVSSKNPRVNCEYFALKSMELFKSLGIDAVKYRMLAPDQGVIALTEGTSFSEGFHYFVRVYDSVLGDRVYDSLTGPGGMAYSEWIKLFVQKYDITTTGPLP